MTNRENAGALGETDTLVRTTREVAGDDRARAGVARRDSADGRGDVLTACIPVDRLDALADLDVAAYVEISWPLRKGRVPAEQESTADNER